MKPVTRGLRQLLWPRNSGADGQQPLRPTAYLDGLRGFAAFLVYIHHHQLWAHNLDDSIILESWFGYDGKYYFAALPGIRTLFVGGHVAVAVFYVISGYVLTVKPLSLIHAGEFLRLFDNLASAFFRRWFRLYIPLIVTTLVYVTSWHALGYWNSACEPKATFGEELWNWYVEFKNFSFLFKESNIWVTFNTHLWSIPLEMRGSIIVFTACMALARATIKARLLCEVALAFYFLYIVDGYYGALFMTGMLQSELDLLAKRDGYFPGFLRRLAPYKTPIFYAVFVIGMLLAGVPAAKDELEYLSRNPGWYWLSLLKPQAVFNYKWFYLFFAGNMIVASVPRIATLKRFFESRFCQYLGRISFALYLVHGPIIASIGDRVYYAVGWLRAADDNHEQVAHWANLVPLPKAGPLGLEIALIVPNLLILLPLTLWTADFVTRVVDAQAVRFSAWLYRWVQGEGEPEQKRFQFAPLTRLA